MRLWKVANAHILLIASVVAQPGEIKKGLDLGAVGRRRTTRLGLAESIPRHGVGTCGAERGAVEASDAGVGRVVDAVHPGGAHRAAARCVLVGLVLDEHVTQCAERRAVGRHGQRTVATGAIGGGVRVRHRVIEQDERTVAPDDNIVKYAILLNSDIWFKCEEGKAKV